MSNSITRLVDNRRAVKAKIAALQEDLAVIDELLMEFLANEPYADDEGRLSVSTRTTVDKAVALTLVEALPSDVQKQVLTTTVDTKALKALAPEVYEQATRKGKPFLRETTTK